MSPEMKTAQADYDLCVERLDALKHRAIQGDAAAALVLVDAAVHAARAVQELWFTPPTYNTFRKNRPKDQLARRRDFLRFFLSNKAALPVLHPEDSQQAEMLRAIKAGPFKDRKRKATDMKMLMDQMLLPIFDEIRIQPKEPAETDGEVWRLPPLAQATIGPWAGVAVTWLWSHHKAKLTNPASWLYKLAKPETEALREVGKKETALDEFRRKRTNPKIGAMELDHSRRFKERQSSLGRQRQNPTITASHIKNGLRSEIAAYLKRNLSRTESPQ